MDDEATKNNASSGTPSEVSPVEDGSRSANSGDVMPVGAVHCKEAPEHSLGEYYKEKRKLRNRRTHGTHDAETTDAVGDAESEPYVLPGAVPSRVPVKILGESKTKRASNYATPRLEDSDQDTTAAVVAEPPEVSPGAVPSIPSNMLGERKTKRDARTTGHHRSDGTSIGPPQEARTGTGAGHSDSLQVIDADQQSWPHNGSLLEEASNQTRDEEQGTQEILNSEPSVMVSSVNELGVDRLPEEDSNHALDEEQAVQENLVSGSPVMVQDVHRPDMAVARPVHEESNLDLQQATEYNPDTAAIRKRKMVQSFFVFGCLLVLVLAGVIGGILSQESEEKTNDEETFAPSATTSAPTFSPQRIHLESLLPNHTLGALSNETSPQSYALEWLVNDSAFSNYSDTRLIQRYALATLFFATGGTEGFWHVNATVNWLSYQHHECDWSFPVFESEENYIFPVHTYEETNKYYPIPSGPCNDEQAEGTFRTLYLVGPVGESFTPVYEVGLVGELPREVFLLTSLRSLWIANVDLNGPISSDIGKLSELEIFILYNNKLSGTIPTEIYSLSNLQIFTVSINPLLAGTISTDLGLLTNLLDLHLDTTLLEGYLPTELGLLSKLRRVNFGESLLTGPIPSEIGMMTDLETLELWRSKLSGVIPSEIGHLTSLLFFVMYSDWVTGTIPTEIGLLSKAESIILATPSIHGTIPSEIGALSSSLRFLLLGGLQLSGTIPTNLFQLSLIEFFYLFETQVSGTLPTEIGQMTRLLILDVKGSKLSGTIPTELGLIQNTDYFLDRFASMEAAHKEFWYWGEYALVISLVGNTMSGPIPSEIGQLDYLQLLDIASSGINGTIPTEIGNLSRLSSMSMHSNKLSGTIPTELGELSFLQQLSIHLNGLTGTIPTELGKLSSILFLYILGNYLSGTIPVEMESMSNALLIYMMNNGLSGVVPTGLCSVNDLGFDCSDWLCGCSCGCNRTGDDNNIMVIANITDGTNETIGNEGSNLLR